jgi:hypothetical protein
MIRNPVPVFTCDRHEMLVSRLKVDAAPTVSVAAELVTVAVALVTVQV